MKGKIMKKSSVSIVMAGLVACAAILSSCVPSKTVDNSATSYDSTATVTKISFSDSFPDPATEGDVIDLNKFITITPANAAWSVTSSSDIAVIKDHTLTLAGTGEYTLTVTAGANSKKLKKTATVISTEVKAIREFISTAMYNYTTTLVRKSNSAVVNKTLHADKYTVEYPNDGTKGSGLAVLKDNNIYSFAINGTTVTPEPGIIGEGANFHYYYVAAQLPIIASQIADEFDADGVSTGNVVILPAADDEGTASANMKSMALALGYSSYVDGSSIDYTKVTKVVLSLSEDKTTLSLATYTSSGATGYYYTVSGIGAVKVDALESYTATGDLPAPAYLTDAKAILDLIPAKKNYAVKAQTYWSDGTKEVEPTTVLGKNSSGETVTLADFAPNYAVVGTVTSTGASFKDYTKDGTSDGSAPIVTSYQKKDTSATTFMKVVQDSTKNSDGTLTPTKDKYTATATTISDLFGAGTDGISVSSLTTAITEAARYSQLVDKTTYKVYIDDAAADSGAFAKAILAGFPIYGDPLKAFYSSVYDTSKLTYETYLTACELDCYAIPSSDTAKSGEFRLQAFSYGIDNASKSASYNYVTVVDVAEIGTSTFTAIDNANITFPA